MKKRHVCFLAALGVFAAVSLALTDTTMAQSKPSHRKPPEGMVSGPWADAVVGTRAAVREVQPNITGDVVIEKTTEVVAADERSVTVKVTGTTNGKRQKDQQGVLQRFVSPSDLEKASAQWGRKEGRETLKIGDKQVECDIYRKREKHPTRDIEGVQTTYVSENVPSWVVRVVKKYSGEGKTMEVIPYSLLSFTWGP
jgi:hypothetical protein